MHKTWKHQISISYTAKQIICYFNSFCMPKQSNQEQWKQFKGSLRWVLALTQTTYLSLFLICKELHSLTKDQGKFGEDLWRYSPHLALTTEAEEWACAAISWVPVVMLLLGHTQSVLFFMLPTTNLREIKVAQQELRNIYSLTPRNLQYRRILRCPRLEL